MQNEKMFSWRRQIKLTKKTGKNKQIQNNILISKELKIKFEIANKNINQTRLNIKVG